MNVPDLTTNIMSNPNLTDKTKKNYSEFFNSLNNRLNMFQNVNETLFEITTKPDLYINVFKQWFINDATLKVYIISILLSSKIVYGIIIFGCVVFIGCWN